MSSTPSKQLDESMIAFYEEQLMGTADIVYRFAFGLTLSLDGAWHCVKETYQRLATNLEKYQGMADANITALLVAKAGGVSVSLDRGSTNTL